MGWWLGSGGGGCRSGALSLGAACLARTRSASTGDAIMPGSAAVCCSLVAVVWELGLLPLLGYQLDPYTVLVPF